MTDRFEISRRKALAALGTIGVASGGAGLGTSAYFNDTESFENNIVTAGTMDLIVDYYSYWNQGSAGSGFVTGAANGDAVESELTDVKPGDSGLITLCPRIETNPAYLWLCGELTANDENGQNEPEVQVDDTTGARYGELAQNIDLTVEYCEVADDFGQDFGPEDVTTVAEAWTGTLADFLATIRYGVPLDGGAAVPGFPAPGDQQEFVGSDNEDGNYCLCLDWKVPTEVGNEIQSDTLTFDLQLYAQQSRHNSGTNNPCLPEGTVGSGDFSQISYDKAFSMQALSRAGSGRGEIQIHGDSGGVENTTLWGPDPGDTFPANTDVGFTASVDPSAETASLTINGVTVTDDDVTDGDANAASTGEPEWPQGVPSQVDIALTASSGSPDVTTVVKDVTLNGNAVSPDEISSVDDLTFLELTNVPATSTVTVEGTLRFEGSTSDFNGQSFVGIDWR
ncbi:hypothetical protein DVK02_12325 [Halobellus sp. Atlit-31R]|nr:hypothetical protein DVK02_12325 [Halobellus sp. Atlit-31R]